MNNKATDELEWLEQVEGEDALKWVETQNRRTADKLKSRTGFDALYTDARAALDAEGRIPLVHQQGDHFYELRKDAAHARGLYRRTTMDELRQPSPAWETVLDIDKLSADEGKKWVLKGITCAPPAHRRCLVSLSVGGRDSTVVREFDATALAFVDGGFTLDDAKGEAEWVDNDHIFVARADAPQHTSDAGYPRVVRLWKRGTPYEQAPVVFESDPSSVWTSARRIHMQGAHVDLISERKTFWTAVRYQWDGSKVHKLAIPEDAEVTGAYQRGLLLLLKSDWTVGGRAIREGTLVYARLSFLRGDTSNDDTGRIEVIAEPTDTRIVVGAWVTGAGVLVHVLDNVRSRLQMMRRDATGTWASVPVPVPVTGAVTLASASYDSNDILITYEDFLTPTSLYHIDGTSLQRTQIAQQPATFDADGFEATQQFATSKDGTRVPYFLVARKGLQTTGDHPTHIFAYGGFRVPLTPSYSGTYESLSGAYGKLWLERGGVFALANIRGGGEYGPQWHRAALRENRPRAFEDLEAIAEDLANRGISSAKHIAIEGRSNGGLLVSATLARRPELYGAVVCGVPLTDMRRYHKLLAGSSWMAEYGDPDNADDWAFIGPYSPLHNIRAGADYPPILIYTSTKDDRVHPAHARKLAHKMLAQGHDALYYENLEGGHLGSSTNEQLAYRLALVYTFLWQHLKN